MAEKRLDPRPFFVIAWFVLVGAGMFLILGVGGEGQQHHEFASCLADNNATMYGFDACPHCNAQKALIGKDAFKKNFTDRGFYVKCRPESEASRELGQRASSISSVVPLGPDDTQGYACEENVGQGTPTWVINGEKYVGEQSLETLGEAAGCEPPSGTSGQEVGGFTPEEGE